MNITSNLELANKIRNLRISKGLTQIELAKKINISKTAMNKIEKGTRYVTSNELAKIAEILNISTDYLVFGKDHQNTHDKTIDFKEAIESEYGPIFMYGGKEIPQEDLAVIKRILDSNLK